MKYMSLESYEDALSNIELKKNGGMAEIFGDDYILQYMLDIETRDSLLNVKAFTTPFEYEMRITEKNETKLRKVDVCETFNYLIGLTVVHQGAIQRYQTVEARNPEYEGAVDLVVDREGQYQFRQIEGTLRNGDKVLIIWRNITDDLLASNAALDAYFLKYRLNPRYLDYDIIYVNGDSNLENLRRDEDHWKVERTETEFNRRMFEEN
jgi:adenine-specific DNA-methyltransferase